MTECSVENVTSLIVSHGCVSPPWTPPPPTSVGTSAAPRKPGCRNAHQVLPVQILVQFTSFSCLMHNQLLRNWMMFQNPLAVVGKETAQQLAAPAASCRAISSDVADPSVLRLKHSVIDSGVPVGLADYMSGMWQRSSNRETGPASSAKIEAANFEDTEMLKNIFQICASCRHVYMPVFSGLGEALDEVLERTEPDQLPGATEFLGKSATLRRPVPDLVHFSFVCSKGRMRVDRKVLEDTVSINHLSACFLGVLAFKSFSTSRWLTIGQSCRTLLASWLTGYQIDRSVPSVLGKLLPFGMETMDALDAAI